MKKIVRLRFRVKLQVGCMYEFEYDLKVIFVLR
jgi:hypothetical protein